MKSGKERKEKFDWGLGSPRVVVAAKWACISLNGLSDGLSCPVWSLELWEEEKGLSPGC